MRFFLLVLFCSMATVFGATPSTIGGVRVSTDTSGTNTIAANMQATNLNGGGIRTALMLRDVQVTNAVVVKSAAANYVAGFGANRELTNTTVTTTTLSALASAGTNNWVNDGPTNSTLAGIAKPWRIDVTNSVNVGQPGEAGLITISNTNGVHTISLFVASDGTLTVAYGSTNMLTLLVGANANNNGSETNFLSAAGYYTNVTAGGDTIWTNDAGVVEVTGYTNIQFKLSDGGGYFGSQALYEWSSKEFVVERDNSIDGDGRVEVYFEGIDSLNYNQNAGAYFYNSPASNSVTSRLTLQAVDSGTNPKDRALQLQSAYDTLRITMSAEGTTYVDIEPTASASTLPFKFNTTVAHTSNDLFDLQNNGTSQLKVDTSSTARDTRFFLYDVDSGALQRVTVGIADSGGAGFKVLRIPN